MCTGPTIKTPPPVQNTEKKPVYLRNPYLDGLGINAESTGRNSLVVAPGSAVPNSASPFLGIAPNPAATSRGPRTFPNFDARFGLGIAQ